MLPCINLVLLGVVTNNLQYIGPLVLIISQLQSLVVQIQDHTVVSVNQVPVVNFLSENWNLHIQPCGKSQNEQLEPVYYDSYW